jgi:hypothetical protein
MNCKISSAISVFVCLTCLLAASDGVYAQSVTQPNAQSARPAIYTTAPKLAIAKLKSGESNVYDVRGRAAFTVTAANDNDTVAGTLVYTIPDDARQKIAQLSAKPLAAIPASVTKKEVITGFQSGTACPVVILEIGATELELAGTKLRFHRITLDVIETADQVPQHFCAWTRQINAKRQRRGIIASLNRLLTGEQ